MCGIVGIASVKPQTTRKWLSEGRDALIHRGPDDSGEWWAMDGRVGLAHRRLSILDLSSSAHQPMHDVNNGLTIVFNGEIYNFKELRTELKKLGFVFRTSSDTEVLLAAYKAWGTDCLSHLNGMFAFALYDAKQQVLFLARDRAGEKPLFYHHTEKGLRFASELKALLVDQTLERKIDAESLDCYLATGYVPGDRCILKGFNKLPPAHALKFELQTGKSQIWQYWKLPKLIESESYDSEDEDNLLDELESLLEDSVSRQLVADVPVGVLLSGGVDSSLITAMAVRASNNVQTFTIGFPGHGKLDETEHARLIARHFGTQHTELMAEPATANLLQSLAQQFDEPMVDSSMIPTFLVSQLVRKHCTVALGGDGGDELFGGYDHYSRLVWMKHKLGFLPRSFRSGIASISNNLMPLGMKGRNWLNHLGEDLDNGLPLISSRYDLRIRKRLLHKQLDINKRAETIVNSRIPVNQDILQRSTRMDFRNYLAEDILVKVDRASMMNSLEVRAPLLDQHLIEFAFGKVPSYLKATAQDKKILLKRLTARVLPPEFDRQRKQGFSIPLAEWLKGGAFRELFNDTLRDPQCIFNRGVVDDLLNGQDRGRNNSERLFALVFFELWRREYRVTF